MTWRMSVVSLSSSSSRTSRPRAQLMTVSRSATGAPIIAAVSALFAVLMALELAASWLLATLVYRLRAVCTGSSPAAPPSWALLPSTASDQ
jgi:hypothetical protein